MNVSTSPSPPSARRRSGKKTVDFSDGYLAGYLSVLTSDAKITGAEGLAGKRLGVVQGTLQEIYAAKNFKDTTW